MPARLTSGATLADLQRYVAEMEVERGFAEQSTLQKCLLLGEEVGELFKAVRETVGATPYDSEGYDPDAAGELADVVIMVCSVANHLGIDLEDAFRAKEAINETRSWD